ncbi:charged multivesicular body protein 2a [Platysternon megacephalum]|uniref:Charged multivesicular body protein 2a n=1 Tax=Platysternon megacephalum TaxID=55544 RepID=A0A4D9DN19_9SAUR|nr:charged multivesicular body protein 2a [Platysternon megacephalum]
MGPAEPGRARSRLSPAGRGEAMRRGERRSHGGALSKAALEEQPDGGVMEAPPGSRGDSPPAAPDSAAPGLRRSTESEVYDDGTNTFFW